MALDGRVSQWMVKYAPIVLCLIRIPTLHNHKVLNYKCNETEIDNCSWHNKDTFPLPNSYQTKSYQTIIDCNIAGYKQKYYLCLYETTLKDKIVSGIMKSRSTALNITMIRNYQKNFEKLKSAVEHQKLDGK